MAFATDLCMPGAYQHRDGPITASSQSLSAGLFRTPVSPSGSTYNLGKSTSSLYSDVSMSNPPVANPKRKRANTRGRDFSPADWRDNMETGFGREGDRTAQTRYTLAGQIDTPRGAPGDVATTPMEESVYSDIDYRRALGSKRAMEDSETPNPAAGGRPSAGWSTLALQTIGGVVGRVFDFCTAGAFKGFYAGGGAVYEFQGAPDGEPATVEQGPSTAQREESPPPHQIPGGFPQPGYMPYVPEDDDMSTMSTPESTPVPAAKRRQIGDKDDLVRNWVLVDEPQDQNPTPSRRRTTGAPTTPAATHLPSRRQSQYCYAAPTASSSNRRISVPVSRLNGTVPTGFPRRNSMRVSHVGSPKVLTREPASFASPRPRTPGPSSPARFGSPIEPVSRIPVPVQPVSNPFAIGSTASRPSSRQQQHTLIPSPAPGSTRSHHRTHSTASGGSFGIGGGASVARGVRAGKIDVDDIHASPRLTDEAKQLAHRKLAAERETDAQVDALNMRLSNMIRQCKEALGTKVEVYDDSGAGWEDDEL